MKLFEKVCDSGEGRSCYNAGNACQYGKNTKEDYYKARLFYNRFCGLEFQRASDVYYDLLSQGY